jgi:acyl-CoA hydrolase
VHAAFFLGPKSFYKALRDMPPIERDKIQMKAVSFTNELYGDEIEKRAARVGARFVNNAMMATLLGSVISDGLENGAVVSGVGGQYNFVAQAFALKGARSIITLESTRLDGKTLTSNIRWSYGHETIPRHLRDIIVTEYGVADLRGRSDEDVIDAMLRVADSRFQTELMRQAKDAGKLRRGYDIPKAFRENSPERISRTVKPYREDGSLPDFPFGTDFTAAEQRLIPALLTLKQASHSPEALAQLAWRGLFASSDRAAAECLSRLELDKPVTWRDRAYRTLLRGALS